jgi:hypothetical protein
MKRNVSIVVSMAVTLFVGLLAFEQGNLIQLTQLSLQDSRFGVGACTRKYSENAGTFCTPTAKVDCLKSKSPTQGALQCPICHLWSYVSLYTGCDPAVGQSLTKCEPHTGPGDIGTGNEKLTTAAEETCDQWIGKICEPQATTFDYICGKIINGAACQGTMQSPGSDCNGTGLESRGQCVGSVPMISGC